LENEYAKFCQENEMGIETTKISLTLKNGYENKNGNQKKKFPK